MERGVAGVKVVVGSNRRGSGFAETRFFGCSKFGGDEKEEELEALRLCPPRAITKV